MKKFYALVMFSLLGCIIFSSDFVNAGGSLAFIDIKLPVTGYYTSSKTVSRTSTSYKQEYYNTKTITDLTGNEIKVKACVASTSGTNIDCLTLDTAEEDEFGGSSIYTGSYKMKLKRATAGLAATHNGSWKY